jgi:hypothetical protein
MVQYPHSCSWVVGDAVLSEMPSYSYPKRMRDPPEGDVWDKMTPRVQLTTDLASQNEKNLVIIVVIPL